MADKDGGPAFPSQALGTDGLPSDPADFGMSLRDWFAGQADIRETKLESVKDAANFLDEPMPDVNNMLEMMEFGARLVAKFRYVNADAMLKAREQKP